MTDIIESNFSQIKDILRLNRELVILPITKENNKDITKLEAEIKILKNDLTAKDSEIKQLSSKVGELKGKD